MVGTHGVMAAGPACAKHGRVGVVVAGPASTLGGGFRMAAVDPPDAACRVAVLVTDACGCVTVSGVSRVCPVVGADNAGVVPDVAVTVDCFVAMCLVLVGIVHIGQKAKLLAWPFVKTYPQEQTKLELL